MKLEKEINFCNMHSFCEGRKYCNGIIKERTIEVVENKIKIDELKCTYYIHVLVR